MSELFSVKVTSGGNSRWLTNVKKNLTEISPKFACTFDKVQAERVVKAYKALGFVQEYEVVPTPEGNINDSTKSV